MEGDDDAHHTQALRGLALVGLCLLPLTISSRSRGNKMDKTEEEPINQKKLKFLKKRLKNESIALITENMLYKTIIVSPGQSKTDSVYQSKNSICNLPPFCDINKGQNRSSCSFMLYGVKFTKHPHNTVLCADHLPHQY